MNENSSSVRDGIVEDNTDNVVTTKTEEPVASLALKTPEQKVEADDAFTEGKKETKDVLNRDNCNQEPNGEEKPCEPGSHDKQDNVKDDDDNDSDDSDHPDTYDRFGSLGNSVTPTPIHPSRQQQHQSHYMFPPQQMPGYSYYYPPSHHPQYHPHQYMHGASYYQNPSFFADASNVSSESIPDSRRNRGGVTEPFPEKLHRMLEASETEGKSDVVSFFSHGRAFAIHKPRRFVNEIMPKYFKQSKLTSFQRQLNLYGFRRISSGVDNGGYWHPLFLKDKPRLCASMKRVKIKGIQGTERETDTDPNFYALQPLKEMTSVSSPHSPQDYSHQMHLSGYPSAVPGYGYHPNPWASPYPGLYPPYSPYPPQPPPSGTPPRSALNYYSPYGYPGTVPFLFPPMSYGYPPSMQTRQIPNSSPGRGEEDADGDSKDQSP